MVDFLVAAVYADSSSYGRSESKELAAEVCDNVQKPAPSDLPKSPKLGLTSQRFQTRPAFWEPRVQTCEPGGNISASNPYTAVVPLSALDCEALGRALTSSLVVLAEPSSLEDMQI